MRFHGWSLAAGLSLVAVVALPHLAAAACPGVCDPVSNVCCTDDCTFEDANVPCHPAGEPCRTKKCDGAGNCNQGGFNPLPVGEVCEGADPCLQGTCNGAAQCINQDDFTCADGNDCTNDYQQCEVNGQGKFVRCDITRPGVLVTDGTTCSSGTAGPCQIETCSSGACVISGTEPDGTPCGALISGAECAVKGCASGQCTGAQQGQPVACAEEACKDRTCVFQGSQAVCVKTAVENGTPCDTDPWDCTHQRCNKDGVCKSRRTTTLKECDANLGTSSHCRLSYCTRSKTCRTGSEYLHYLGQNAGGGFWEVETAETRGRANIIRAEYPTCVATDGNACTTDKCVGNLTDACANSCDINDPCPIPACGDICDVVNGSCTCRDF